MAFSVIPECKRVPFDLNVLGPTNGEHEGSGSLLDVPPRMDLAHAKSIVLVQLKKFCEAHERDTGEPASFDWVLAKVQDQLNCPQSVVSVELGFAYKTVFLSPSSGKVAEILTELMGPSAFHVGAKKTEQVLPGPSSAAVASAFTANDADADADADADDDGAAETPPKDGYRGKKYSANTRVMYGVGLNKEEQRYAKGLVPVYNGLAADYQLVPVSSLSNKANQLSRCRLFELFEEPDGKLLICAAYPHYEVYADATKAKKRHRSETEKALDELDKSLRGIPDAVAEMMPASELLSTFAHTHHTTVPELLRLMHAKPHFCVHRVFYRSPETESSDKLFRGTTNDDLANWQTIKTLLDAYQQSHQDTTSKGIPLDQLGSSEILRNGNLVDLLRLRFGGVLTITWIGLRPPAPATPAAAAAAAAAAANSIVRMGPPAPALNAEPLAEVEPQALDHSNDDTLRSEKGDSAAAPAAFAASCSSSFGHSFSNDLSGESSSPMSSATTPTACPSQRPLTNENKMMEPSSSSSSVSPPSAPRTESAPPALQPQLGPRYIQTGRDGRWCHNPYATMNA